MSAVSRLFELYNLTLIMVLKYLLFTFISVHSEKMVKKKPKFGALPTLNLPKRSHDATKPAARPSRSVVNDDPLTQSSKKYYQSFYDLCKRVKTLKTLNDWIVQELEDRLVLKKKSSQVTLPEFEIMIDDSLGFTIYVYGGSYQKTTNCTLQT